MINSQPFGERTLPIEIRNGDEITSPNRRKDDMKL